MERESFEDPTVAEIINKNFIPIKVDREERPEVDSYYMSAVQGMTGQGGWPLTVFLTPDLKAFYGGTYFPPEPRYGIPGFKQVLEFVAKLWKDNRGEVNKEAERIFGDLKRTQETEAGGKLSAALLDDGFSALAASFDSEYGGFGVAPKFPMPLSLELLLRYHFRTGKELALNIATRTMISMAAGGIHDHVGGGFHRYSTDKQWLVPHFEKMLYDNALLANVYLHGYQITGDPKLAEVARGTLGWMLAELESPDGGFYSAQDADTTEGEGVYYTWTPDEVEAVLGIRDAESFCRYYGITKNGNFEGGRSILHVSLSAEELASNLGKPVEELGENLAACSRLLYETRLKRPRPSTDTKILTSWNGLAISAMAEGYVSFRQTEYRRGAERAADFILSRCLRDGVLRRRFAGGEAGIPADLEDYAFLGLGLLDLFEATSDGRWLEQSISLANKMQSLFEDKDQGGFFTAQGEIPTKLVETYDGPVPSGNSAAVAFLLRLAALTGGEAFTASASRALSRFQAAMDKEPSGHSFMLQSVDWTLNGTREVVVSARTDAKAGAFLESLWGRYLPDVTSFVLTDKNAKSISRLTPLAEGRAPRAEARAYVCQNFSCKLPAESPGELKAQLGLA